MNFGSGYDFPAMFDDNAIAQELFIEMLCYYLNDINDARQKKQSL